MADNSAIGWTDATWNPVTGCTKVSPGCARCYIERQTPMRIAGRRFERGQIALRLHPERLEPPLHWRRPRRVFVNSMSDVFHEDLPAEYVAQMFDVMARADWHVFQVLTKRHERLVELAPRLPWPANVWMGVSIENRRFVHRADYLRQVAAAVRFISAEPLLGPLDALNLDGIDWLIVGGESGPHYRPMKLRWVRELRELARLHGAAFFMKQDCGPRSEQLGRFADEAAWPRQMPATRLRRGRSQQLELPVLHEVARRPTRSRSGSDVEPLPVEGDPP
jgi:protein gp37